MAQTIEKMSLTVLLPPGMKAWLKTQGDPNYRSAPEQAAYLCAQYLTGLFKRVPQASKNGDAGVTQETAGVTTSGTPGEGA